MQSNDRFKELSFPYVAIQPSTNKSVEYGSISDIYNEIIRLYDMAEQKGYSLGETLYDSTFYFVDHGLLTNTKMQNRIKEFQFCKTFSCSPYPSLQETPAEIIDDFFIIEEEYNICLQKQKKDKNYA